eukprot:COSAG05_NODE_2322_length_3236_cov_2.431304_5_plen_268_part_01
MATPTWHAIVIPGSRTKARKAREKVEARNTKEKKDAEARNKKDYKAAKDRGEERDWVPHPLPKPHPLPEVQGKSSGWVRLAYAWSEQPPQPEPEDLELPPSYMYTERKKRSRKKEISCAMLCGLPAEARRSHRGTEKLQSRRLETQDLTVMTWVPGYGYVSSGALPSDVVKEVKQRFEGIKHVPGQPSKYIEFLEGATNASQAWMHRRKPHKLARELYLKLTHTHHSNPAEAFKMLEKKNVRRLCPSFSFLESLCSIPSSSSSCCCCC